jgi:hypothetical protein
MLLILNVSLQAAASAKPVAPRLCRPRSRSNPLNTHERDVIAGLFAVLESLVLSNELLAEAQGVYNQAVPHVGTALGLPGEPSTRILYPNE